MQQSQGPESNGSKAQAGGESGSGLSATVPRNIAIILGILILGISTTIAWMQWHESLPNFGLHFQKTYWFLEPLTVPADSDLPYFNSKILAVSHNEKSLWVGGESGLLAHSEDEGKTWKFLHLYGYRFEP
jgi:hypothetical protein